MKNLTRILIVILAVTTLVPVKIGLMCLFDHASALEFFKINAITPGMEKLFTVMGGFILATTAIPLYSIYLLIKKSTCHLRASHS